MPQSLRYGTILQYVSSNRLDSYKEIFEYSNDAEIYGAYIWAQHAAASLYPILQNLEITLRNAINIEAKRRFGDYWWDFIGFKGNRSRKKDPNNKFFNKIEDAKRKLNNDWKRKERKRLGLGENANLPQSVIIPTWPNHDIVAATDFSAWEFLLLDAFSTNVRSERNAYLFPMSTGRIFQNYNVISPHPDNARKQLLNLVKEIREYRNRIFHHETVWIKSPTVTDDQTAMYTIRQKINRTEKLLSVINTHKLNALVKVGLFEHARRICSLQELKIYTYGDCHSMPTKKQKRTVRKLLSHINKKNETKAFEYADSVYAIHKIR